MYVMDYARQGEHLDSRRFGKIPVDGHASRTTVDGKGQVTVYGAWIKRIEQKKKLTVLQFQLEMDMHFLLDRDDRDYIKVLETFSCDHKDGHKRILSDLLDCLLSAPYDSLPFLTGQSFGVRLRSIR